MSISGTNFQFGQKRGESSYYFSRYVHVWGWATWRRAWDHFDLRMPQWPEIKKTGWLSEIFGDRREVDYWTRAFEGVYRSEIDSWAYPWVLATWLQSGLSVIPGVNLVSNIGFGGEATHTRGRSRVADIPTEEISFPLKHPDITIPDLLADRHTAKLFFRRTLLSRAKMLVRG